jgi:hypothetical protein
MNVDFSKFSAGPEGGGGAGSDPGDVNTFAYADLAAARADESSRSTGDIGQIPTGMVVMVSGTYVPKWCEDNGAVVITNTLLGDVLPASASIPWSETKTGTATITTDGTHVNFVSGLAADNVGFNYTDTEAAGGIRWIDGLFTWNSITQGTNAAGNMIRIQDGAREPTISTRNTTDPFRYAFFNKGADASPIGNSGKIEAGGPDLTVEHRLTIISDADNESVTVYVDGVAVAMSEYTLFTTATGKNFLFGDFSGAGTIDLLVRALAVGVA